MMRNDHTRKTERGTGGPQHSGHSQVSYPSSIYAENPTTVGCKLKSNEMKRTNLSFV